MRLVTSKPGAGRLAEHCAATSRVTHVKPGILKISGRGLSDLTMRITEHFIGLTIVNLDTEYRWLFNTPLTEKELRDFNGKIDTADAVTGDVGRMRVGSVAIAGDAVSW